MEVQSLLNRELAGDAEEDDVLFAIYLYDETELVEALEEKEKIKLVAGHIYIDNYEEAIMLTHMLFIALNRIIKCLVAPKNPSIYIHQCIGNCQFLDQLTLNRTVCKVY